MKSQPLRGVAAALGLLPHLLPAVPPLLLVLPEQLPACRPWPWLFPLPGGSPLISTRRAPSRDLGLRLDMAPAERRPRLCARKHHQPPRPPPSVMCVVLVTPLRCFHVSLFYLLLCTSSHWKENSMSAETCLSWCSWAWNRTRPIPRAE